MKILRPLINQLVKIVKEGYDLGKRELPLIAKELLAYSFWVAVVEALVLAVAVIGVGMFAVYLGRIASIPATDHYSESHSEYWFGVFLLLAVDLGLGAALLEPIGKILKIKMAPRVFLLETLREYLD